MNAKKVFIKKLLVLLLCFGILTPILSSTKQYVRLDKYFAVPYSDLPNNECES